MPLCKGDKLGSYEILSALGAGGMGEVYRARGAKLQRDVAIVVLPAALASDARYIVRFEREAAGAGDSSYGIQQGALAMELVVGESPRGPLPVETALSYARQIADALEAARTKRESCIAI
jgi:serine/threonine-protein kinase